MLLNVGGLPDCPLAAAAAFHADILPRVRDGMAGGESLILVFAAADHTHHAWRLAAVQGLAREYAPNRVNAIAGDGETAIAAAARYLDGAPGVTGQLLPLDSHGAGEVIPLPQ